MRKARTSRGGFQKFLAEQLKDEEIRIIFHEERARTRLAVEVAAIRKQCGLTQKELASRAGTTQAVISRMEGGNDSRMPSLKLLGKLAKAMKARLVICFDVKQDHQ
jgi:DNA-binding XRE family transcriptional regulator